MKCELSTCSEVRVFIVHDGKRYAGRVVDPDNAVAAMALLSSAAENTLAALTGGNVNGHVPLLMEQHVINGVREDAFVISMPGSKYE